MRIHSVTPPRLELAFSLVEMSIVLVILGLLVGGVLSGQSLMRASELRSIGRDYQTYTTAIHSFRDKYFALPGDLANATSFWGKDNANCPSHSGTAATNGTCNGNGDGLIRFGTVSGETSEAFQAWKQLSLSGLIDGNYTGLSGPGFTPIPDNEATEHLFGVNSPSSRLVNVGWGITHFDNSISRLIFWSARNHINWLSIGKRGDPHYADDPFLKPEEAWNIDTKFDDGKPASGGIEGVLSMGGSDECTNSTGATDYAATYRLSSASFNCSLIFKY